MSGKLVSYDAVALGELIRDGEIKPIELVETTIQRIEQVNPELNVVIHKVYDQARETAKRWNSDIREGKLHSSPFSGVPFLLKDLIAECKGTPLHEGSRGLKGYNSKIDCELVRRHKVAGLIVTGKTNTPEFGSLPNTASTLHGATLNPWNPTLTPGGSSGGSAAAVAAGIVPMAHGNDAGGSIRVPASCCGIFGLKPTRGRNPLGPMFGDIMSGLICEHAVTLTVRDSAALLDATSGSDLGDPYCTPPRERPFLEEVRREMKNLKIGFLKSIPEGWHFETHIHNDCKAAVEDSAQLCEDLGHRVEEIASGELAWPNLYKKFGLIWSCGVGHIIHHWEAKLGKKLTQDQIEPMTWMSYQAGLKRTGTDYLCALEEVQCFSRKIAHWYDDKHYDIILSPTISVPPAKLVSFEPVQEDAMRGARMISAFLALTYIYNLTGQPAMSIPLFWNNDNIPIGVQFAGRFGDEATLFRLASQLEESRPWVDRKPPIHCSNSE
jgi:amidase